MNIPQCLSLSFRWIYILKTTVLNTKSLKVISYESSQCNAPAEAVSYCGFTHLLCLVGLEVVPFIECICVVCLWWFDSPNKVSSIKMMWCVCNSLMEFVLYSTHIHTHLHKLTLIQVHSVSCCYVGGTVIVCERSLFAFFKGNTTFSPQYIYVIGIGRKLLVEVIRIYHMPYRVVV